MRSVDEVVELYQCWCPNWEGCVVAMQERVLVFRRYTLENLRMIEHHVRKRQERVMEQMWQNVNNWELWVKGM